MLGYLILLFCAVPFVELWLLFALATKTSVTLTLLIVILTGVVGATLARWQGFHVLRRIQQEMDAQRMPTTSLVDAAMILVAGALLLTPGILTDVFGFSLLVPPIRAFYRRMVTRYLKKRITVTATHFTAQAGSSSALGDNIIDARVVRTNSADAE